MSGQGFGHGFWLAAAVLLATGLAGYAAAIGAAVALTAARVAQLAIPARDPLSFALQVHASFLLLLALGFLPSFGFLHWNLLAGTWLLVLTDYCILARCLALLPWNRAEPLTWRRVGRTLFSWPVENILDGIACSDRSQPTQSTRDNGTAPAQDGSPAVRGSQGTTLSLWWMRSRTRACMAELDERMLRDLGIGYYDAWRESRKWFWQR